MTLVSSPSGNEAILVFDFYDRLFIVQLFDKDNGVHEHEQETEIAYQRTLGALLAL